MHTLAAVSCIRIPQSVTVEEKRDIVLRFPCVINYVSPVSTTESTMNVLKLLSDGIIKVYFMYCHLCLRKEWPQPYERQTVAALEESLRSSSLLHKFCSFMTSNLNTTFCNFMTGQILIRLNLPISFQNHNLVCFAWECLITDQQNGVWGWWKWGDLRGKY